MNKSTTSRKIAYRVQTVSYAIASVAFWALSIYTVAISEYFVAAVSAVLGAVLAVRLLYLNAVGYAPDQGVFAFAFYLVGPMILYLYRDTGVPGFLLDYSMFALVITFLPAFYEMFLVFRRDGRKTAA
jgi:hypothetical protein